ncbi:hypothetical protein Pcinc_020332 [Petrolisthes cinctipes]|uniref:Sugar phosphate transporter domain-containing protein n=1 Tax=Petrolisthes cinctipes TaxID=88211 RepID=A0AAE1FID4_PETCI|nr:hypothetical protein Pcinc_020332 [Petrolisthes cinctipes]
MYLAKYKHSTKLKDGQGQGLGAAVFYGICSASMAFLNKAVISSYEFPFPFFIMACQMLVTVVFLELLGSLGWVNLPAYTWRSARSFLIPSMAYAIHASLSLMALQGMNIPMYGAVKRCTPLVNLVLATLILRRPLPSLTLTTSILTITAGCFVAVLGDLTFDSFAYTMGVLSVIAQGLYLTLVQQCAENQLSTLEILQLNSYNTLAPFIIVSCILREPEAIIHSRYITDLGFHSILWTLVCLGAVLNYSLFLCTALNSAITTSLVSVAKSVVQTMIGFFVFGGVRYHPLNITGIVMNTVGGFLYTYTKYQEGHKKIFKDENYNKLEDISVREVRKDQKCLTEVKVS